MNITYNSPEFALLCRMFSGMATAIVLLYGICNWMLKFLLFCPLLIVLYIQIAVPRPVLCHINIKRMEHFNERWCNKNRDWGFWRSWNLALRQRNTVSLITRKWEISCEDWGISIIGTVYLQSWQTFVHLDFFLCLQKGISVHRKLRIRTGARRLRLFSLKIWFLCFSFCIE